MVLFCDGAERGGIESGCLDGAVYLSGRPGYIDRGASG